MDKVSIITVTYNASATLEHTIKSVLAQSYPLVEYIIIDGKSTDATIEIVRKYQKNIPYWISEKDNGIYDAMNKGIAAASGDWLFFLGADDVFCNNDVLQEIFGSGNTGTADMIYGNVRLKSSNALYGGSRTYYELIGKNINHQSIFYRKPVFDKVGLFDLSYPVLADYDMNMRIFRQDYLVKQYIPIDVTIFNDKGGASNIIIDDKFFRDKLEYFTAIEKRPANDPMLQQYYFYTGFITLFRGRQVKGLYNCLRAFTSGPRKFFYILVFIKLALAWFGVGKKMKIV